MAYMYFSKRINQDKNFVFLPTLLCFFFVNDIEKSVYSKSALNQNPHVKLIDLPQIDLMSFRIE